MWNRTSKRLFLLALAALLAACAPVWENQPETFRVGWSDGCDSGTYDFGADFPSAYQLDQDQADADYHRGWGTGYDSCYVEAMRTHNNPALGG